MALVEPNYSKFKIEHISKKLAQIRANVLLAGANDDAKGILNRDWRSLQGKCMTAMPQKASIAPTEKICFDWWNVTINNTAK